MRQNRVRTVSLHPPINAEHEAGQATSTIFQFFGVWPGRESNPQPSCFGDASWTECTAGS